MGINGLLPYLKQIQKDRNISQYSNQTVAIDSYCWLHKAIYSCALDLATGVQTDKYIVYCLRKIEVLLSYKIRPVVIFDGGPLPSKAKTESDRESAREEKRKQAIELFKAGNTQLAQRKFGESIDVTPQLAFNLYKALRDKYNIECIVSPYEADAQLAYLSRIGYVDVIITEDSDLLTFGAKKVFYKMDGNGNGKEIVLEDIRTIRGDVSFDSWNHKLFISACIFAGCDYLQSIRGVGFKKAYRMMGDMKNYQNAIKHLKLEGKYIVPAEYEDNFEKAFLTFRFQRVFCPLKRRLVTLNEIDNKSIEEEGEERTAELDKESDEVDSIIEMNLIAKVLEKSNLDFLGPDMTVEMAQKIAYGVIDPITKKIYSTESSTNSSSQISSWLSDGQKSSNMHVPSLIRSSSFVSDGVKFEDEPSSHSVNLSQVNEKAKYYKVAKPKLVGLNNRDDTKVKKDGQKNIRDFFKENRNFELAGTHAFKIKNFFNEKRLLKSSVQTSQIEEKLAPSDVEDSADYSPNSDYRKMWPTNEDMNKKEFTSVSVLKKRDLATDSRNIPDDKNSRNIFRNSEGVSKAFKIPTTIKNPITENEITNKLGRASKRKIAVTNMDSFNEFTFKKIQKREALASVSKDDTIRTFMFESKQKQNSDPKDLCLIPRQNLVLNSVKNMNECIINSEPESMQNSLAKVVYKIKLTTLNPSEVIDIDEELTNSVNILDRNRIQNFFKLNPIEKSQLRDVLNNKYAKDPIKSNQNLVLDNKKLDDKLSVLLMNFN